MCGKHSTIGPLLGPLAPVSAELIKLLCRPDQHSQRLIDGLGVSKYRSHVRVEQDHIGARRVLIVVFTVDTPSEIIFSPHFVFVDLVILPTQIGYFPSASPPVQ